MGSTHYGHLQEVQRRQEEACETQDLERRLAEIYSRIEGGDDASDLTAPQARRLILSGSVKRPAELKGYTQPLLGFGRDAPAVDVNSLALVAFSGQVAAQRETEYNNGVERPAAQPKGAAVPSTLPRVTFRELAL